MATTLPIIESRFIIYSVAASTFPCFPFLKRWAAREQHGLAKASHSQESSSSDGLPEQDAKVEKFMQQSVVGIAEGPRDAQLASHLRAVSDHSRSATLLSK